MTVRRPGRLLGFSYVGNHRYFLTFCALARHPAFLQADIVSMTLSQFSQTAVRFDIAILAYCFMPDHVHFVVEGRTATADLTRFVRLGKQLSGYEYSKVAGHRLWQDGYYDHIVRRDTPFWRIVRYVLENPVRHGLVKDVREYPFLGSLEYSLEDLLERAFVAE